MVRHICTIEATRKYKIVNLRHPNVLFQQKMKESLLKKNAWHRER
jgi:hypothetical protein